MTKSVQLDVITVDHDPVLFEENRTASQPWNHQRAVRPRMLQPHVSSGFVARGAIPTRMTHRSKGVIAVVDNVSTVRHEISKVLSASGYDLLVFHSPEALVASNALYEAGMLILGGLRCGLVACEALYWASAEYADLPTLLLSKGRCIHVCRLGTIYSAGSLDVDLGCVPRDRLESLFAFLRLGSDALPGQSFVALPSNAVVSTAA